MDGNYSIIEDVFEQGPNPMVNNRNQITAARGNIATYQVPEEIRRAKQMNQSSPRVGSGTMNRPDIPHLNPPPPPQMMQHPMMPMNPQMMMAGMKRGVNPNYNDGLSCRDVFIHMENCPLCSQYYKKDVKFYWLIIIMLMIVLLFVSVKKNNNK